MMVAPSFLIFIYIQEALEMLSALMCFYLYSIECEARHAGWTANP